MATGKGVAILWMLGVGMGMGMDVGMRTKHIMCTYRRDLWEECYGNKQGYGYGCMVLTNIWKQGVQIEVS